MLKKFEELARLGFRRNGDPESDQNSSVIPSERMASPRTPGSHRIFDCSRFRANFAAATRTKCTCNARPEQFQVIVDLRHRADGRARALDRVRLLDGDRGRDTADVVHARLVHAVEKLPHVWAERFDVTSLAFGVNRLECQTRFAAAAGACDDRQFPQRKIDIDPFEIVLARPTNLNAILRDWRSDDVLCSQPSNPLEIFAASQAVRKFCR